MKKNGKKKGFTLIELIVVIAILGILAAIAVPKLTGFKTSASKSADVQTASTIGKAAEIYFASNNGKVKDASGAGTTSDTTDDASVDDKLSELTSTQILAVLKQADLIKADLVPQNNPTVNTTFVVTIDNKGNATVSYPGDEGEKLYPAQ